MTISIIIVSWNVRELLKKCLDSVIAKPMLHRLKQSYNRTEQETCDKQIHRNDKIASVARRFGGLPRNDIDFEIIVIDNASTDGTVEMVRREFPQVTLIANKENRGFARANNQGIEQSTGDYVLLLNPDTEFIEDTLIKIMAKMQSDDKIGVLGCQLLNADNTIQPSVRKFPTIGSQLAILTKLHHFIPSLLDNYLARGFNYTREQEVDQVMGAFFCVPRALFNKIGLLDEGYFIWFEEVDFCYRAKRAGYKVVYYPETKIIHHGGQSFAQQMTFKKQWWFFKSMLRYFKKKYGAK